MKDVVSPPSRSAWMAVLGLALPAAVSACATPAPPTGVDQHAPRVIERSVPSVSSEDRARARQAVVQALEALAEGRRRLLRGEREAARERLALARSWVEDAQALLPPEVVLVASPRGAPLRVEIPREPIVIPLSALDAEALERLRPYQPADARGLRVDLDELARRLHRVATSAGASLEEGVLGPGTFLHFERERGPDARLVDGAESGEPPVTHTQERGAELRG